MRSRIDLPADLATFVEERITGFPEEAPETRRWLAPYVAEHNGLPLFLGWTATLALRPTGELIQWSTEDEWPGAREFDEATWVQLALVEGAKLYPELEPLVPERPADARACEHCEGSGRPKGLPEAGFENVICRCAGLGWVPAGA